MSHLLNQAGLSSQYIVSRFGWIGLCPTDAFRGCIELGEIGGPATLRMCYKAPQSAAEHAHRFLDRSTAHVVTTLLPQSFKNLYGASFLLACPRIPTMPNTQRNMIRRASMPSSNQTSNMVNLLLLVQVNYSLKWALQRLSRLGEPVICPYSAELLINYHCCRIAI